MNIYNFEQGTDEWLDVRIGKFTGSSFYNLTSTSSDTELWKKAAERITGKRNDSDKFSNKHTERGHELETEARSMYELMNKCNVQEVGFIELDKYVGCSPDGLIGDDGMIEIKCRDNHIFLKTVKTGCNKQDRTQIQFNLYVTDRKWCDYVCYNPNFANPIFQERIERNEGFIEDIKALIKKNNDKIKEIIGEE